MKKPPAFRRRGLEGLDDPASNREVQAMARDDTMTKPAEPVNWQQVTTLADLGGLLDLIGDGVAALDFETTAFTPDSGRVRLAQICNDDIWAVIDFDQIEGGFAAVAHWFADAAWVVFNAGFEQRWFMAATDEPITCWDVGYLRRAIEGGGHFSLAQALKWDLDYDMPKDEQASDWGAVELTPSQLQYAADDALWTWRLWKHWRAKADADHMRAFNLLNDMIPAVIAMEEAGMLLDPKRHRKLVEHWEELRDERIVAIREFITEDEVENLNSGKQLSEFFSRLLPDAALQNWPRTEKTGLLSTANSDLRLVGVMFAGTPMQDALTTLAEYKTLQKYISSFGDGLISRAALSGDGRVRARYNIAAARTGRFSSSAPNLQQIPRDREFFGERLSVRQSFVAGPGNLLVSLDYSGIELRVLALLAEDDQLLHDMVHGDVHLEVGSHIAGRRLDKKVVEDKEIRQAAKGVSFGIVYGIGAPGLAATMKRSMDEAQSYIDFWAARYPRAFDLRHKAMAEAHRNRGYLRMADGGTIWMGRPDGRRGSEIALTQCANYPVQRAALSIMARAIARHYDSLLDSGHGDDARVLSTIHDALIDEARAPLAPAVLRMMKDDMVAAYLDIFPGAPTEKLVEGGVGPNWGELEDTDV